MSLKPPYCANLILEPLPAHQNLWQMIESLLQNERLVSSYLLVGSSSQAFVIRWIAMLMCQSNTRLPCGECLACKRLLEGIHPDLTVIEPDEKSPIKIDQIRALQADIYQTPQCGKRRYVIIQSAETLNASAANALLKLLEEPPLHAVFFLLAKHLAYLPPTLISRCQRFVVPDDVSDFADARVCAQSSWLKDIFELTSATRTAPELTDNWSKNELLEVVDWLYLLTACLLKAKRTRENSNPLIRQLANMRREETWFQQLDRIQEISKLLHQQVNLNATLTLNYLLTGFTDVG